MICYDIADDRRRNQIAELLLAQGERVQYSVFECSLSDNMQAALQRALLNVIDVKEDSVRFYPLCVCCKDRIRWQGRRPQATLDAYQIV